MSKPANNTASNAPLRRAEPAFLSNRPSPVMEAMPIPMIGDIRGATSIAPMITAGESVIKPKVDIMLDSTIKI